MADDDRGIRERGGDLQVRVSAGKGPDGRRRVLTATVSGTSKESWRRARRERNRLRESAQELIDAEAEAPEPDHTLQEVVDRWLTQVGGGLSANTLAKNRYSVDHYLAALKPLGLGALTPQVIEEHYVTLGTTGVADRPLSPQTIATAHRALHRALEYAVRWGWVERNAASVVEPPAMRRIDRQLPAPAAINALMALFEFDEDLEFVLWLRLAAVTGARRGEICGLRWSDCDLEAGEVLIRRAVVIGRENGHEVITVRPSTKTDKPRRIAVGGRTAELLRAHRDRCEKAAALCEVPLDDGYVFAAEPDGREPWHPGRVTKRYVRARERVARLGTADLSGVRLGDLRHYVASRMLKSGESVTDTAARLGNSPRTVLANYAHHIPAEDHGAAAMLDSLLG